MEQLQLKKFPSKGQALVLCMLFINQNVQLVIFNQNQHLDKEILTKVTGICYVFFFCNYSVQEIQLSIPGICQQFQLED